MLDLGFSPTPVGWAPPLDPALDASLPAAARPASRQAGGFLDIPCSMLLRDLAAVCGEGWSPAAHGHTLTAPKGSHVVVRGPSSGDVVAVLRAAGPKTLQVFAVSLELWAGGGGRGEQAVVCPLTDFSRALSAAPGPGRDADGVLGILEALAAVRFDSGPGLRTGDGPPGPPIVLGTPAAAAGPGMVAFRPGAAWARGLSGASYRVARLPRAFLTFHARNDRYRILLTWYLAIMLRVNRKHGFHYRVHLRTLLEGAGIAIPDRNVSRFLAAIYRALDSLPGVHVRAPAFAMYDPARLLDAKLDVSVDPALIPAFAGAASSTGPLVRLP
jgi:hypothetical protein